MPRRSATARSMTARPASRPDFGATYYAAYVFDPDGNRLEAVHQ